MYTGKVQRSKICCACCMRIGTSSHGTTCWTPRPSCCDVTLQPAGTDAVCSLSTIFSTFWFIKVRSLHDFMPQCPVAHANSLPTEPQAQKAWSLMASQQYHQCTIAGNTAEINNQTKPKQYRSTYHNPTAVRAPRGNAARAAVRGGEIKVHKHAQ